MAKTRAELIAAGKLWVVTEKATDKTVLECGSETACKRFITEKEGGLRRWKQGKSAYSFGYILWEPT